jgi:hypothetical protein
MDQWPLAGQALRIQTGLQLIHPVGRGGIFYTERSVRLNQARIPPRILGFTRN